jgi:hypothetical protein
MYRPVFLASLLLLTAGCAPNEDAVPGNSNENRPGASQEDSGTDRSPDSGGESVAPALRPKPSNSPANPSSPGTTPH